MYPDIAQAFKGAKGVKKGLKVFLMPVRFLGTASSDGKYWYVTGLIDMPSPEGEAALHTVSVAIKATKSEIRTLMKTSEKQDMLVEGFFGAKEISPDGKESFRRVYCKAAGVKAWSNPFK